MICPKCGHEASGRFCSNCGSLLPSEKTGFREEYSARGEDSLREEYGARGEDSLREEHGARGENSLRGSDGLPKRGGAQEGRGRNALDGSSAEEYERKSEGGGRESSRATREAAYRADEEIERREERRGASRKRERSRGKGKQKAGDNKAEIKAKKQLEKRIASLEDEIKQETARKARRDREDRNARGVEETDHSEGNVAEAVSKGVVGIIVLVSRLLQLICGILMAGMAWIMARSFWNHQGGLGYIETMVEEANYGLVLYLGFAGLTLFMGVIWCLWILSRKAAGGNVRLKKYDTGRGFIPFLLCTAVILAVSPALLAIPSDPEAWQGMARGAKAALEAVSSQKRLLLFYSVCGAVLSLIRKILRV